MTSDIVAYLERKPCTTCLIGEDGVLHHCADCGKLFLAALEAAKTSKPITYEERKKAEADKVMEAGHMKNSHSWIASQTFADAGRTRMTPYASHCKACGMSMIMFKSKPDWCPKNPSSPKKAE